MKILVFDNYDSFPYKLVHLVQKIGIGEVEVHRNDRIPLEQVHRLIDAAIIIVRIGSSAFSTRPCGSDIG